MKKILGITLLAMAAMSSGTSHAATNVTGNFDVKITLTSQCSLTLPAASKDVVFTYTSFQAAQANSTGGDFSVACTKSLPYTINIDQATVTDAAVDLQYILTMPAVNNTGTGATQNFNVSGKILGGQGGTCNAATCDNAASANKTRTLTIGF
ncbi:MAG: spore coat protein U domain-containing protein [Betaproteobacteria bacterium]